MKKTKQSPKNEYLQKRQKENPEIKKKDFGDILKHAVQTSKPTTVQLA